MSAIKGRNRLSSSGRVLLRLPPGLHAALRQAAAAAGLSLNDYCTRKLAAPVSDPAALGGAADAVRRAAELFGKRLLGVAAFGSWARQEDSKSSDLDLLIVVDSSITLTRELYRSWDAAPISWEGRRIEPHFVRLPDRGVVAGVWAEVAIDGIVLFERKFGLSRRLAEVRRDIAAGRIVRRVSQGQPYWTRVA
jgi:predicted nucleotidyltransferase